MFGKITGEYGFATADNVYHITNYATDEDGNFKITSMRKIKIQNFENNFLKSVSMPTVLPFDEESINFSSTTPIPSGSDESCPYCNLPSNIKNLKTFPIKMKNSSIEPFKIVKNNKIKHSLSSQQNQFNHMIQDKKFENIQHIKRKTLSNEISSTKNHDQIQRRNFNEKPSTKDNLLYRFDYNTDVQGHTEEGDTTGNKNGEYYSIGGDNIKRIVSYKANELGFMPKIKHQTISLKEHRKDNSANNNHQYNYAFEWFYPNQLSFKN